MRFRKSVWSFLPVTMVLLVASKGMGQQANPPANTTPPPTPYGLSINVEGAKKAAAAAVAEAKKSNLTMAVAVVDTGGFLIYFEKMDGTQTGSVEVAMDKARSAALFRRATKVFQDGLAAGGEGLRFLKLTGAIPIDGGFPLVVDGKIVGAIGASGGTGDQDGRVAKAGADATK